MTDPADHWKLAWDFCDEEHAYDETDEERHRCTRCIGLKAQFDRIAERAYQNGAASHVEHHKCARCYDAGVAQAVVQFKAEAEKILEAIRVDLQTQVDTLERDYLADMEKYGNHLPDCSLGKHGHPDEGVCDCGYEALRAPSAPSEGS